MTEFQKAQKNLKNDMLVLFILEIIIFAFPLFGSNYNIQNNYQNIFSLIFSILLFVGYNFAKKGSKNASTIGIIVGIFMMLTILYLDVIDFMLGLFVLIHSLKYKKELK